MKSKSFLTLSLFLLSVCLPFSHPACLFADADADFESHIYTDVGGEKLPYRLLKPAGYDAAHGPYPLLIFLHGAGERGTDNRLQLTHGKPFMRKAAAEYGSFVLAPQCPPDGIWSGRHWTEKSHVLSKEPPRQMRLLVELLEKLQKDYPIDSDRLYIMGLSMGGFGTWDIIQRYPQRFTAAAPICGGGDEESAAHIVSVPIWVFHGDADAAVPVARSREMIKALKSAGGKPRYSEYPGVGHNSWTQAFNEPELLKWMFEQRRGANNRK